MIEALTLRVLEDGIRAEIMIEALTLTLTLRHRPIHGHNQVRGQDIREGEIRNCEYQGFSILRKNIQSQQ